LKEGSNAPLCQNTCSLCGGGPIVPACDDATRVKRRLLFDRVGVFMADIIFTLMFINERKRNANTYLISNFDSLETAPSNLPP
jgi:hypothetical protein